MLAKRASSATSASEASACDPKAAEHKIIFIFCFITKIRKKQKTKKKIN